MLEVAIIALLTAEGREPIIISKGMVSDITSSQHAEEILVQWALQKYGRGGTTPYRMLDVVTTIGPCNTCSGSVPKLMRRGQNPLLFEATIFAS
jgi:tRNA(Arg) A34 adenosine deaminase TadA